MAENIFPFYLRHGHSKHDHTYRSQGGWNLAHGISKDHRQSDLREEQNDSKDNSDQIDVAEDFFPVDAGLRLHQRLSVGPHQDHLHTQESTGIDHPFFTKNYRYKRDHQISGIGIDDGFFFYHT